ncbi:hypothetical protein CPB83DRAFT_894742 [Crepidotus variabilis]|uniref:Uncharacterized protein n=1 Tax=Crepidotus variabilis TaxID=179855 RepID=A0A9P6EFJ3_9AGAR|nr:hypothetical protein CPB83DRAFT_894742 [Crepidotus variabilis]
MAHLELGSNTSDDAEMEIQDLGIISNDFYLDSAENMINLDRFVPKSMDSYAFIAFTCSQATLDGFIKLIKDENEERQALVDDSGIKRRRYFNFEAECVVNPKYELVALYPEHLPPLGRTLAVFNPDNSTSKYYVSSEDRKLRETKHASRPSLPSFSFKIKFRKFLRDIAAFPSARALPEDVVRLITKTTELIQLRIEPPLGTRGYSLSLHAAIRNPPSDDSDGNDRERRKSSQSDQSVTAGSQSSPSRRSHFEFPADASLEERLEIASAMMGRSEFSPPFLTKYQPLTPTTRISKLILMKSNS